MREWLSGGVSPCQGEGRGFESRLALMKILEEFKDFFVFQNHAPGLFQRDENGCITC